MTLVFYPVNGSSLSVLSNTSCAKEKTMPPHTRSCAFFTAQLAFLCPQWASFWGALADAALVRNQMLFGSLGRFVTVAFTVGRRSLNSG